MIYSISGRLIIKKPSLVVLEADGIGFKILISGKTFRELPKAGSRLKLFCFVHLYENNLSVYGFRKEKELEIFELLTSISGIGPKAALRVLEVMRMENFLTAVRRGRSDLLVRAAGVGVKKAARIILELKDKIGKETRGGAPDLEMDLELEEILKSLGYKKEEARSVFKKLSPKAKTLEERLKASLKILAY